MLPARAEQEYQLLKYIHDQGEPVGSGSVAEWLRSLGFDISEATAGRVLRELDTRGYTLRLGYRGRVLTGSGQQHLEDLAAERRRSNSGQELLNALRGPGLKDLVDVLVARRAIEREAARLAAARASHEDVAEMEDAVRLHELSESGGGPEQDVRFHRLVARASGNRVLMAAVDLIHQDGLLSPVLDYIRKWVKSTIAADHRQVLLAISRRDAQAAERAMEAHIENVIRDVNQYWETVHAENGTGAR
ncbi:MAG: FCD domain-containing protein [Bacillota bacterium]